ncbi:MAG: OmpA family protein [Rhodocyclaceae bacterium]|nr:OmpA family protein [Pseudomonadota bacterium]MDP1654227.1 OmpA family protein [Rhodocyclaceae bacterium]MDP1905595.1 OmpA family protein [Pseudomonadota bacterium]
MKHRAIILALASASAALPAGAHAAEDICSRMLIQAINQFCQLLPNGLNLCQPVALVGPGAECKNPERQTLVPVPLGQPTLQPMTPWPAQSAQPLAPWAAPYAKSALPAFTPPAVAAAAPIQEPVVAPVAPTPILAAAPQPAGDTAPATPETPPVAAIAPPALPESPIAPDAPLAPTPPAAPVIASVVVPEPPVVTPVVVAVTTAAAIPETVAPAAPTTAIVATPVEPPVTTATPATAPAPVTQVATTAPSVATTDDSLVDALAHFDFDSANLTDVGRAALDAWLSEAPKGKSIRVSGHADRLGPEPYNLKLSLRRAEAVKQYLVSKGMNPRRIQLEAKGESDPVKRCKGEATPATKDCLAPNRRVLINPE